MKTDRKAPHDSNHTRFLDQDRVRAGPVLSTLPALPRGEALLTDEEAASLLALSPATMKKWRRIGRGPRYYRLGSAIRYRRDDLEAFISRSAANPRSQRHDEKSDG